MSLWRISLGVFLFLAGTLGGWVVWTTQHHFEKQKIVGRVEKAVISDKAIELSVRMDTGAQTSSLSAHQIQVYKTKTGKKRVRFIIEPERTDKEYQFDLPLIRYVHIRKRQAELDDSRRDATGAFERRPVVKMPVCLGKQRYSIEVTLTNRSNFNYPMLLGRSGMQRFGILIDPDKAFIQKPRCAHQSN